MIGGPEVFEAEPPFLDPLADNADGPSHGQEDQSANDCLGPTFWRVLSGHDCS